MNYLAADMAQYFVQGSNATTGSIQPPSAVAVPATGLSNPVAMLEQQTVLAMEEEEGMTVGLGHGKRKVEDVDGDGDDDVEEDDAEAMNGGDAKKQRV